jgi:peptidoglycan hydrolase CwlO-like protein
VNAPYGPGPPQPPTDALPPDAPATIEDVRAARRWMLVALAWAIAASIIAVLALVQASDDEPADTRTTPDLTPRLERFESQTNDRLDAFSKRLDDRAAADDVQKLDKRLAEVEDDASTAKTDNGRQGDAIEQLQTDVDDLKKRVEELEQQSEQPPP